MGGCVHCWVGGWPNWLHSIVAVWLLCSLGDWLAWEGSLVVGGPGTVQPWHVLPVVHRLGTPSAPFPATGFSQLEQPPSLFVLMGNFQVREEGTFNSALTCASACSAVAYPRILCRGSDCCHSLCASSLPTVL